MPDTYPMQRPPLCFNHFRILKAEQHRDVLVMLQYAEPTGETPDAVRYHDLGAISCDFTVLERMAQIIVNARAGSNEDPPTRRPSIVPFRGPGPQPGPTPESDQKTEE